MLLIRVRLKELGQPYHKYSWRSHTRWSHQRMSGGIRYQLSDFACLLDFLTSVHLSVSKAYNASQVKPLTNILGDMVSRTDWIYYDHTKSSLVNCRVCCQIEFYILLQLLIRVLIKRIYTGLQVKTTHRYSWRSGDRDKTGSMITPTPPWWNAVSAVRLNLSPLFSRNCWFVCVSASLHWSAGWNCSQCIPFAHSAFPAKQKIRYNGVSRKHYETYSVKELQHIRLEKSFCHSNLQ